MVQFEPQFRTELCHHCTCMEGRHTLQRSSDGRDTARGGQAEYRKRGGMTGTLPSGALPRSTVRLYTLDKLNIRAVPARLGLEAPALAWPEGALAFSALGPSQSHWNGLALAWPGFRPRLSKAVTQGLAPALAACPALTMLHCHLLSGLRNNERGKTQRQKGYFVSSYC
jgi:hypothetical protein